MKYRINNGLLPTAIQFNSLVLDEEIDGFKTIKINGREAISNELVIESVHEGSITLDNYLPSRSIEVTYALKAESTGMFQDRYKVLRKILTTDEEAPIKFTDEPQTVYFGRLSTFESVPDNSMTVVSTFTINCDSPYKFSDLVITNGSVEIDTFYPTLPEQITLTIGSTTNKIEITNGSERITATGTFNAGSKVVILFKKEEVTMTVNGTEATYMIDLQSDLENFVLKQGQDVTCEQGTIELRMRERWL